MVYKWAKIPDIANILRADGTEIMMNKNGEGQTRLVMVQNAASPFVSKIELKVKKDGTPETLTNQAEVDFLKHVPRHWRLQFYEIVEEITIFSRWDTWQYPATMMLVERFDMDLMKRIEQLLEVNDIRQLVIIMQLALPEMLNLAVVGLTITDMTLGNLCFHGGTIRIADWGCGRRNAPVSALRDNFKKLVACFDQLVGAKCDMAALTAVYSLNRGHELISTELRDAIDALCPRANALKQSINEVQWGSSSDINEQPPTAPRNPQGSAAGRLPTAAEYPSGTAVGSGSATQVTSPDIFASAPKESSSGDAHWEISGACPGVLPSAAAGYRPGSAVGSGCCSAASPSLPVTAPKEPAIGDEHWESSGTEAGDLPPTAAEYPPGTAVGKGGATRPSLPVVTPPGLDSIGTMPKSASSAISKPPPILPPWASNSKAQLKPRCAVAAQLTADASTQTELHLLTANASGVINFDFASGPSLDEFRKHIEHCRWVEYQIKLMATQEKLAELGRSKTQIRRILRKNAEDAAKVKTEEVPPEDEQPAVQPKSAPPERSNSNTRRRQKSRATKRAVTSQRVEEGAKDDVDAKRSQWARCSDGDPTTPSQWRNWWYNDWQEDDQGTYDYSGQTGSSNYTHGAWHSSWR